MTSQYEDIYNCFLGLVDDYEFLQLSKEDAYELMGEWLSETVSRPKLRKLFKRFNVDDDMMEVEYELRRPIDDEYDLRFVEKMLATGMIVGWMKPRLNSDLILKQVFGTKEEKFFSQQAHGVTVKDIYIKAETELDKDFVRDHAYAELTMGSNR